MAYRKSFSCLFLIFGAVTALSGQITIRAGISAPTWSAGQGCPSGQFVAASPDNLHVFKAINLSPGVAGGTQPLWNTNSGAITGDGSCTWKEWGTLGLGAANGSPGNNGVPFLLRTNSPLGTVLDQLVTYDCGNLDTNGFCDVQNLVAGGKNAIGVCIANCGTSGIATIGTYLSAPCTMDGPGTAGDVVAPSPTNPGQCTDEFATTSQINVQTVGRISKANVGGAGSQAQIDFFLGDLNSPGSSSGPGSVSSCGSGVGANAYYPGIGTVVSCDPLITDDGAGHGSMRSLALTDSTVSGNWFDVAGPSLPAIASIPIHSFAFSVNPSFGTSYGLEPWDNAPVNGNCISAVTGDGPNYFKLHDTGAPCGTGSGTEVKVNNVDTSAQTPINFQNSPTVNFSNPSMGNIQADLVGSGKISTPSAPVLTTNGSAGVISYTYGVVGCEDPACVYHTALSATATIATGNATLTSSNSINLKTYGDTLYGVRGFLICRTASAGTPATVGVITSSLLAGKQFVDTGLAGDGTNCASVYASNTTTLQQVCLGSALPGVASPPGAPCGVDAPPATPNARDDENTETFGAPGDVNNPFWTWGNQLTATASWSNGTLLFTTDSAAQAEYLVLNVALPGTPFTFHSFFSLMANSVNQSGQDCFIGLRESSSAKITTIGISHTGADTSPSSQGNVWVVRNWTSNSANSAPYFSNYAPQSAYVKLTDDGTNLNYSFSNPEDGVQYHQYKTQTVITPFTTAPNQMIIGAAALGGVPVSCTFDFTRWP